MKKTYYEQLNSKNEIQDYRNMLEMMGSLSKLFSENGSVYLHSRVTENLFCRCLNSINLSRSDITADSKKNNIGFGIKTWINSNVQKIAEFNKDNKTYGSLSPEKKILKIAKLRNDRIDFTLRSQNLKEMIYHCIIRKSNIIHICESPLNKINIDRLRLIDETDSVITFKDNLTKYSFNKSKSTLYKTFDDLIEVDRIEVNVIDDPYSLLKEKLLLLSKQDLLHDDVVVGTIYLPLYSYKNGLKVVNEKSGLNLRFANGRNRDLYEVYIPIPKKVNEKEIGFFPSRNKDFELHLSDGRVISAKVCQDNDKALMSNPNKALGHWLIDDIFSLDPREPFTYELMSKYGIDSVVIEKHLDVKNDKRYYSINFASIGSYEKFMGNEEFDE